MGKEDVIQRVWVNRWEGLALQPPGGKCQVIKDKLWDLKRSVMRERLTQTEAGAALDSDTSFCLLDMLDSAKLLSARLSKIPCKDEEGWAEERKLFISVEVLLHASSTAVLFLFCETCNAAERLIGCEHDACAWSKSKVLQWRLEGWSDIKCSDKICSNFPYALLSFPQVSVPSVLFTPLPMYSAKGMTLFHRTPSPMKTQLESFLPAATFPDGTTVSR